MNNEPPIVDGRPARKKPGRKPGSTVNAMAARRKGFALPPGATREDLAASLPDRRPKLLPENFIRPSSSTRSRDMVSVIMDVFNFLGGEVFLAEWARDHPTLFMTHIVSKIIPKEINLEQKVSVDGGINVTTQVLKMLSMEQLKELEAITEPVLIDNQAPEAQCQEILPNTQDTTQPNSATEAATADLSGSKSGSDSEPSDTTSEPLPTSD